MAGIAPVVTVLVMVRAVLMVNLHVLMDLVSMAHGHVTAMVTVLMAQTKPIVLLILNVLMVNLTVMVMELSAFMAHGHVTVMVTVPMVQTKLIVLLHHVKIKEWLPVMMANVYQHLIIVMDQLIPVTQDGVLTVQMAQMKV